jgi:hypothetical protein
MPPWRPFLLLGDTLPQGQSRCLTIRRLFAKAGKGRGARRATAGRTPAPFGRAAGPLEDRREPNGGAGGAASGTFAHLRSAPPGCGKALG